jgi:hypothetical protein
VVDDCCPFVWFLGSWMGQLRWLSGSGCIELGVELAVRLRGNVRKKNLVSLIVLVRSEDLFRASRRAVMKDGCCAVVRYCIFHDRSRKGTLFWVLLC